MGKPLRGLMYPYSMSGLYQLIKRISTFHDEVRQLQQYELDINERRRTADYMTYVQDEIVKVELNILEGHALEQALRRGVRLQSDLEERFLAFVCSDRHRVKSEYLSEVGSTWSPEIDPEGRDEIARYERRLRDLAGTIGVDVMLLVKEYRLFEKFLISLASRATVIRQRREEERRRKENQQAIEGILSLTRPLSVI